MCLVLLLLGAVTGKFDVMFRTTRGQWPFRLPSNSAMNHDGSGLMASITHAFMLFFLLNASISPSSIKFPRTHLPILLRTANLVRTGH